MERPGQEEADRGTEEEGEEIEPLIVIKVEIFAESSEENEEVTLVHVTDEGEAEQVKTAAIFNI